MRKFALAARSFLIAEEGPTAVEYAVMLVLIVVVCFTAIMAVGTNTNSLFQKAANTLP